MRRPCVSKRSDEHTWSGHRLARIAVMYRVCISLVDSTRARLFTFARTVDGAGLHEELVERTDLVNVGRHPVAREPPADPRADAGRQYSLEEPRDHHLARQDAEFARTAMAALRELVDEYAPQRVVVCAGPRMLGKLRASSPGIMPEHMPLDELARDLVKLSPREMRDELASHGLLPQAHVG
jgi:protein required for attachment to host cells